MKRLIFQFVPQILILGSLYLLPSSSFSQVAVQQSHVPQATHVLQAGQTQPGQPVIQAYPIGVAHANPYPVQQLSQTPVVSPAYIPAGFSQSSATYAALPAETHGERLTEPRAAYQQVSGLLASTPQPGVNDPAPLQNGGFVTKNYRLQKASTSQFERKFFESLGNRYVPIQNLEGLPNLARFRMPVKDGSDLDLSVDRQSGQITVIGSNGMVDSTLQIVRLLDVPADPNSAVEVIQIDKANQATAQKAAKILNEETRKTNAAPLPKPVQNTAPTFQTHQQPTARFALPNTPVTQQADQQPGRPTATPQNNAPNAPLNEDVSGSVLGPVQIDIIDDVLFIKGQKADVENVKILIKQIEAMSREYEPVIELVDMKNADSYRISQLVQQLYSQVYQPRKGSVVMIPLLKPNTILLAGKKESIDTAKELIEKLDTPVSPESEFLIVRLKNASSDTLQTQIMQFYANRADVGQGLETRVNIVSDYRTNSLLIQASRRDLTEVAAMIRELDSTDSEAVNTVKTFQLKNALASNLATTLQSAISGTSSGTTGGFGNTTSSSSSSNRGSLLEFSKVDTDGGIQRASVLYDVRIVADTPSNTLIVTAPKASMPLIEALVKELDQLPSAESQIKVFMLVNGDASALTTVLTNLFATSSSSTGGFGGGTAGQTSQIATRRPGIEENESTLVSVRFQADVRTNSILACGSPGDMAVVEAILLRLDEENTNNRKVIVFKPFNNRASDIATAIQNYMTQERQLEIQNSSTYYPQSPQEQYRKEVIAISEDVTNTLIVSATPRYFEQIRRIVAELDERPLMVAIQVLIAEVRLSNNCEHGIELGLQDSVLFDRSINNLPGFLFGDPAQGLPRDNVRPSQVGSQGITSLGVGRTSSRSGTGGFVFSASSESVSVLIRALEEKSRIRTLANPHLTVMHEQVGSISVGQKVPYVAEASTGNNGNFQTSTDFYEVGTILDIIPRIMPDGVIALGIHAERSSVSESDGIVIAVSDGEKITSPRVNQAIAETTIHARDGQTIVFAGLITEQKEEIENSVPILNRIPIVKRFFEYKSVYKERTELLIILTPTIIRSDMDVEVLRQQEASRMHWCVNDVVRLTGKSNMKVRASEWSPCEAPFVRAEAVILDESQLPSEEKVRMAYPMPTLVPNGEQ